MSPNEFVDTEEPITPTMIDELERRYGFTFPAEVREHYLRYNGGVPARYLYNKNGRIFVINEFLPIAYGTHLLEDSFKSLKVDQVLLPSHLVPFAVDPGGNYYCFSIKKEDVGSIWFYVGECSQFPDRAIVYLAASLLRFIEDMTSDDDG